MSVMCAFLGSVTGYRIVEKSKRFLSINAQTDGMGYFNVLVWDDIDNVHNSLYEGATITGHGPGRVNSWLNADGEARAELSISAKYLSVVPLQEPKDAAQNPKRQRPRNEEEAGRKTSPVSHQDAARMGVQAPAKGVSAANAVHSRANKGVGEDDLNDEIPF
jgi:hypothetical protein